MVKPRRHTGAVFSVLKPDFAVERPYNLVDFDSKKADFFSNDG
jgi:hypothetical protein